MLRANLSPSPNTVVVNRIDNPHRELIVLPSLKARQSASGGLVLTKKFLEGASEYARSWPGPVTSLFNVDTRTGTDMDQIEAIAANLDTGVELRSKDPLALAARLKEAAVVLAFLTSEEQETAEICHRLGIPLVFITEYTPLTLLQIADATKSSPLRRWRRKLWARHDARKRIEILQKYATALQCNGTPTYDLYNPIVPNSMFYLDNRVRKSDVINNEDLAAKADHLKRGAPLRLVFGGRLIEMKGVLDLPRVAMHLNRLNVPYQMDIYGGGALEETLRQQIAEDGLSDNVALHPPRDFRTGWIPLLKRQADLFVLCHPQGDPSSTYSEVMSCGVPIVGYDNEAFAGIVRESGAGRTVPMHDAEALAKQIAALHKDRAALIAMSQQSRDFARAHCFEATFERRVSHMIAASRLPKKDKLAKG